MDDLLRLRSLLDMYEAVLEELRRSDDPGLEELVVRLECREAEAAYAYYELLHPAGANGVVDGLPRRSLSLG